MTYASTTPCQGLNACQNLSWGIFVGNTGLSADVPKETCLEA